MGMGELDNMVVVVTGASSGIGAATAEAVVGSGASVVLAARRVDRLEQMVARFGPDKALAVATDVKRAEDSRRLVVEAVKRFGRVNAFVANAGIGMYGSVLSHSDEEYDVAHAIVTVLGQPRHVHTTQWAMWSMAEQS
jgi:NADP-dependent 3-hydroxy acid dehydrogenase YdfG